MFVIFDELVEFFWKEFWFVSDLVGDDGIVDSDCIWIVFIGVDECFNLIGFCCCVVINYCDDVVGFEFSIFGLIV